MRNTKSGVKVGKALFPMLRDELEVYERRATKGLLKVRAFETCQLNWSRCGGD